jgi:hypothetical protein
MGNPRTEVVGSTLQAISTGPMLSPNEIATIFDATDRTGRLSRAHRAALLDWYEEQSGGPAAMASWVARPPVSAFDPSYLEGVIAEDRLEKLIAGSSPSRKEIEQWQELRMRESAENDGDELHSIFVWPIQDDRGRHRFVAALHRDPYVPERILGVFEAPEGVSDALPAGGWLEWV